MNRASDYLDLLWINKLVEILLTIGKPRKPTGLMQDPKSRAKRDAQKP